MQIARPFSAPVPSIRGTAASDHLDLIRGLAAMAVLVGHTRALFFVDYAAVTAHTPGLKLLYFASGFGHQAVMVFFVMSGYLIGSSVIRTVQQQTWSWSAYVTNRLTRLLVVLIPALVAGAVWDHIGIAAFGSVGIYGGAWPCDGVIAWRVADRLTPTAFLGNALFLQGIWVPTFGSNGPLWSLNYEFWYYILFAVLVVGTVAAYSRKSSALPLLAVAGGILALVGPVISLYFLIWLMGVGVAMLKPAACVSRCPRLACLTAGTMLFGALYISRVHSLSLVAADFLIGVTFAAVVYTLLHLRQPVQSQTYRSLAQKMAGFSYTLYLVHLPVLVLASAVLVRAGRWNPDGYHLLIVGVLMLAVLGYAYGLAQVTEVRTDAVRRAIYGLSIRSRRALAAAADAGSQPPAA